MSQVKFAANMDKSGIDAAIKSIQTRGAKLDGDIQLTGLSILAHVEKNKEPSTFQKLYNALPQGSRRNALVAWALAYGQISVNMDKDTAKERPFLWDTNKVTNLKGATEEPWFLFKKEKSPREAFSLEATIIALQELLAKQVKAGKVDAHDRRVEILMAVSPNLPEAEPESASNDDTTGTEEVTIPDAA